MDDKLEFLTQRVDYLQRVVNEVDAARDQETVQALRRRLARIPVIRGDRSTTPVALGIKL